MPVAIPFIAAGAAALGTGAAIGFTAATAATIISAASLAFAAGSIIGNLLFPTHTSSSNVGPRVGDLSFQTSTYGVAIPIVFGTDRLSGNIIWAIPIKEVSTTTTQSSGGKKGSKNSQSSSTTTFAYFGTFAVGLCEGPKTGIIRIWANGNLIYDQRTGTDVIKKSGVDFTFYSGSETQLPDPTIEADKGSGNVPAHRGLCYVVFRDLPLADSGNTLPSLSFEVVDEIGNAVTDIPLVQGSTIYETIFSSAYSMDIDYTRNVGYARIGGSGGIDPPFSGIVLFDLTTMAVYQEVLWEDIMPGETSTLTLGINSLGTDHNLYFAANVFPDDDVYIVEVDTRLMKVVDRVVIGDVHPVSPFSTHLWSGLLGTKVFGSDGTSVDYIFYCRSSLDGFIRLAVLSTSPLDVVFYDGAVPGYLVKDNLERSMGIAARGEVASGRSDFYVTSNLLDDLTNVVSELRRIRIGSGGSISVEVVRTFVPGDFSGTAVGLLSLSISGVDLSAGLMIMMCVVAEVADYSTYVFAVDTSAFATIWSYEVSSPDVGLPIAVPEYGNVHGDIIGHAKDLQGAYVLIDTSTGEVSSTVIDDGTTLPVAATVYWDSTTKSFIKWGDNSGQTLEPPTSVDRIYVGRHEGFTTTLGSICTRISSKVNNSAIDVSEINGIEVTGFSISRSDSAANALNTILVGFQVDVVESDYEVKFKARGSATVVDLTEEVLVGKTSAEAPEAYKESFQQSIELPSYLSVTYEDPELDYQPNAQHDQRVQIVDNPTVFSGQTSDFQIPIVMSATSARQMAEKLLYTTWLNRHTFQVRLAPRYLWLDPADPVNFTLRTGYTLRARLGKTDLGVDFTSDTILVGESDGQYDSSLSVTVTNPFPLTIPVAGPSFLILLDVPLLRDGDEVTTSSTRGYWGASTFSTGNYQGATLYESSDSSAWEMLDSVAAATPFGHVESPPPDPTLMWALEMDTSLTVYMANGSTHLVSVTTLDLCNGANSAALIKSNGEIEVFQYRDVTALGSGRFTLTNLLRGRRGTDTMALDHAAGELFVLLGTGTVHGLTGPISQRDIPLWWGAVTAGAIPDTNLKESFTFHARDKVPYSPVNVTATLVLGTTIDLAWTRRTRVDGAWRGGTDVVPLHEASEAYDVEIYSGEFSSSPPPTLVRTFSALISPSISYSNANILTDFGTIPATLSLKVYQLSSITGRGFSREDTVVVG